MIYEQIDGTLFCRFDSEMNTIVCAEIAGELSRQINAALQANPDSKAVFDLIGTRYIASSFLRLCVQYHKMFGNERFTIINVSDNVKEVFDIAALTDVLSLQ
jgi:anti-anti-sigma regulatory factor